MPKMPKNLMIIFLYGPDTYRSQQKLKEIVEHYKKIHKSWLSLKYFDAKEDSLEDLLDWLKQSPMFKEKKLVVLKNALKFANHLKPLAKSDHIILFFEESTAFVKFQDAKVQKFEFLQGGELRKWVKKEFDKLGAHPELKAIEKLISFVGSDSWRLSNEIKKLSSYTHNISAFAETSSHLTPRPAWQVSVKDVELLVRPKVETDIFETIDAVAEKNKKEALSLLKKHLQKGDSPVYLLAMINYQFRNLLLAKSKGFERLKLHPFVARKSIAQARLFTADELKKIYRKIFEADLNIKTGKMEPKTALDLLISEI